MKLDKYIGIPFVDKGRDLKGSDCYGLAKVFYKEELGIDIPDVLASPDQVKMAYMEYLQNINEYWIEHYEPELYSIVALKTSPEHPKLVTHFGVVVEHNGKLKMLHTFRDTDSHLVDLDNPIYKNKIKAYYKWRI
jgi:hypothetical protein